MSKHFLYNNLYLILQREKNAGSSCIISMSGDSTTIKNPENGSTKMFAFDYSYWSHDSFQENGEGVFTPRSGSTKYTDQVQIPEFINIINIIM